MKLITLRTDPRTRRAVAGFVTVANLAVFTLQALKEVVKLPDDAPSKPHWPKFEGQDAPFLLIIKEGIHRIYIPSPDGCSEIEIVLRKGDAILFCDFDPEERPPENVRFCYSGHWSQQGAEGATLSPNVVTSEVDLEALGFQLGLPT